MLSSMSAARGGRSSWRERLAEDPAAVVHFLPLHVLDEAVAALFVVFDQFQRAFGSVERQFGRAVLAGLVFNVTQEHRADAGALQSWFNRELAEVGDIGFLVPRAAVGSPRQAIIDRADDRVV